MHMADGMYGMVIVDPAGGRPAAREYVIVQSEFYGSGGQVREDADRPARFRRLQRPGASATRRTPLLAKAGELVRIFIVNAGPNSASAFHVIGALFSNVESEGFSPQREEDAPDDRCAAGRGRAGRAHVRRARNLPVVTHKFTDASKGATGLFKVS